MNGLGRSWLHVASSPSSPDPSHRPVAVVSGGTFKMPTALQRRSPMPLLSGPIVRARTAPHVEAGPRRIPNRDIGFEAEPP